MGIEPPFLYDHPSKYSFVGPTEKSFDPRAATRASWSSPRERPKVNGPLIKSNEFNKHPDSYFVVPYGNLNWKPMSPRTKSKVKWTRTVQLVLRILECLGALGLLFCVICIKGTGATTGWIIRLPPAVAMLHTLYAIYHLSRPSNGRTPSSSGSYMLFAAIIDAGLIPFLVFTVLISRAEHVKPENAPARWATLFGSDEATTSIVSATFLISLVAASLHLISLAISLYLGVIFRKIAQLPPDENPLEDNLTSRHKRNKSSLLDNETNKAATVTDNSQRDLKDPLLRLPRTVPFMHTRNDSHENIKDAPPLNPDTEASHTDGSDSCHNHSFDRHSLGVNQDRLYDQPLEQQTVRIDFPEQQLLSSLHSRTSMQTPFYDQPPAHRSSHTKIQGPFYKHSPSPRSSRPHFETVSLDETPFRQQSNIVRSPTKSSSVYSSNTMMTTSTALSVPSRARSTVPSFPDSNWITHPSPSISPSPSPPRELKHLRNKSTYEALCQISPFEYAGQKENIPRPLEMNPPTPPIQQQKRRQPSTKRPLTPVTGNPVGNWGPGMVGIGKAKAWGGMGRTGGDGIGIDGGRGGRVVSRSGVEVQARGILPSGGVRAREVSGKVMEEGRGNGPWM